MGARRFHTGGFIKPKFRSHADQRRILASQGRPPLGRVTRIPLTAREPAITKSLHLAPFGPIFMPVGASFRTVGDGIKAADQSRMRSRLLETWRTMDTAELYERGLLTGPQAMQRQIDNVAAQDHRL